MSTERHYGSIVNGRLKASSFAAVCRSYPEGTQLEFTVRKAVDRRTNPQNRFYWGIVLDAIYRGLKDGGTEITRQGAHEALKFRFLKEENPVGNDGEFITTIKSTSELSVEEFVEYTDKCIRFAAEYLNVVIPQPGEQVDMDLAA